MLIRYRTHLLASGRAAGTVQRRLMYIEHLLAVYPHLERITTADLEQWLADRRHSHKAETRKAMRSSFRVFFSWAADNGYIAHDPSKALLPIRIPATVPRLAPDDAVRAALQHATLEQRGMILLARLGCLRLTELTTLRLEARQDDTLTVLGKGEKERLVYLNPLLLDTLQQLEQVREDWYFPGRFGGHLHPQSVNKIIQRVTGCNPHSLRHAGATAAFRATHDLRAVQEMLGHASMATTQRYLHLDEDARRAVALGTSLAHVRAA